MWLRKLRTVFPFSRRKRKNILVSVVSGTYNRLNYLRRMVQSTRRSLGGRIPHEFVIVDGGSEDGTIEWCRSQEDINLIEQGELLGAVKAFNAGAREARGRYTILANDDVEFVGTSILRAVAFMEDHTYVGVGCFFQDRGGKEWHVETMPAVMEGQQGVAYYGQVCIVPTWLGNKVGWWGDYLHTYGGDNELSANILELGYRVTPIECACIRDLEAQDVLREINKGTPGRGQTHPDTTKWHQKWASPEGLVGPNVPAERREDDRDGRGESQRILYAPLYEPNNELQRRTKTGLYEALSQHGLVYEYDYIARGTSEQWWEVVEDFQPDLLVLQVQDAQHFTEAHMRRVRETSPQAKIVTWNGDYHPDNLYNPQYAKLLAHADLAGFALASGKFQRYCKVNDINWFYWQIGYEEADAEPDPDTPKHDVVFLGNGYSAARRRLGQFLVGLRGQGIDVGLYGSWPPEYDAQGQNLYDFDEGAKIYRNAKIAISDQQWPEAKGYVSNRLFQAMAAGGCLVLQQRFKGYMSYLGLEWMTHLDLWEDLSELADCIEYWLHPDNEQDRARISKAGHEYVRRFHSFDRRAEELMDAIS